MQLYKFIISIKDINQKHKKYKKKFQIFFQYFPNADFCV